MSVAATLITKVGSSPWTLLGWWTVFNTKIFDVGTCKSKLELAIRSVNQAIEGRHYSRAVQLHKQSLELLLRYNCEKKICQSNY